MDARGRQAPQTGLGSSLNHIVSHGTRHGFYLLKADGSKPDPEELGAEFKRVKNVGIRAAFLSSCKSARGRQMATAITQTGGIPYRRRFLHEQCF